MNLMVRICLVVSMLLSLMGIAYFALAQTNIPQIGYSTYLGGINFDTITAVVVDGAGNAYVTGQTQSHNFPMTTGVPSVSPDVFVAKFNATGETLDYVITLGGSSAEGSHDIALDAAGNIYITGWTDSTNFPTTNGAFDTTSNGMRDIFVAKIDPTVSTTAPTAVTFLGGMGFDEARAMAVHAGQVYLTGGTTSSNFIPGNLTSIALDSTLNNFDAFVAVLDDSLTALTYATYLGGAGEDEASDIAVDAAAKIYVVGNTFSANFPISLTAFNPDFGLGDGFLTTFDIGDTKLDYGTYIGGSGLDVANALAIDASGNAYITGYTQSSDFETKPNPGTFDNDQNGAEDAYILKVNPALSRSNSLIYATYMGGSQFEVGQAIAVDATGNAYFSGESASPDLPITPYSLATDLRGNRDLFVGKLNPLGTAAYVTYFGGSAVEASKAMALATDQSLYLVGETASVDFPIQPATVIGPTYAGGSRDGFISKVDPITPTTTNVDLYVQAPAPFGAPTSGLTTVTVQYGNQGAETATNVLLTATIAENLIYVDNSTGQPPQVSGNDYSWTLPGLAYLDQTQFELTVQMPSALLASSYPLTFTVVTVPPNNDTGSLPNQSITAIRQISPIFLPIVTKPPLFLKLTAE